MRLINYMMDVKNVKLTISVRHVATADVNFFSDRFGFSSPNGRIIRKHSDFLNKLRCINNPERGTLNSSGKIPEQPEHPADDTTDYYELFDDDDDFYSEDDSEYEDEAADAEKSEYQNSGDYSGEGGESFDSDTDYYCDEMKLTADDSSVVFNTEGSMALFKGVITLAYEDSGLIGVPGSVKKLIFHQDNRSLLTISSNKRGMFSQYTFENGKRCIITPRNTDAPFQTGIFTESLRNNITMDGGSMSMSYITDINGSEAELVDFSLRIDRCEELIFND